MSLLPDWAPNIHPLVVHFPIAWWIAAVIVDLIALMLPRAAWANTTASTLYPAGAVSAAVAYFTGRQAAATVFTPGMAHPIVLEHWNWALVTTIGFALIAVLRIWVSVRPPAATSLDPARRLPSPRSPLWQACSRRENAARGSFSSMALGCPCLESCRRSTEDEVERPPTCRRTRRAMLRKRGYGVPQ